MCIRDSNVTETGNTNSASKTVIINTRLLNQNKITKTIISTNLSLQNLFNNYLAKNLLRLAGEGFLTYSAH